MEKNTFRDGLQASTSAKLSLALLCAQNVASLLLLHTLQTTFNGRAPKFNLVTAVSISEALKLISSLLVNLLHGHDKGDWTLFLRDLRHKHVVAIVPAALYTVAIMCQSAAAQRLDLALYIMMSQLKILFTPIFSSLLLRQSFTRQNWVCLFIMAGGMCLIQLGPADPDAGSTRSSGSFLVGVVCMTLAGLLVAFSGVYLEAKIKGTRRFWVVQSQLSAYSTIAALVAYVWQQRAKVTPQPVSMWDTEMLGWVFIVLQVIGGPLVGWCVAVTNSTAKNYAQGMSFLIATAVGFYKAVEPNRTPIFFWGMGMLLLSICWSIYMSIHVSKGGDEKDRQLLPGPNGTKEES